MFYDDDDDFNDDNPLDDQMILLEFDQSDSLSWVLSQNEDRTYALEVRKRLAF